MIQLKKDLIINIYIYINLGNTSRTKKFPKNPLMSAEDCPGTTKPSNPHVSLVTAAPVTQLRLALCSETFLATLKRSGTSDSSLQNFHQRQETPAWQSHPCPKPPEDLRLRFDLRRMTGLRRGFGMEAEQDQAGLQKL